MKLIWGINLTLHIKHNRSLVVDLHARGFDRFLLDPVNMNEQDLKVEKKY